MVDTRNQNTLSSEKVDVHTLGEFEYCPRAGVLAFERQNGKPDSEAYRFPDMSYTPPFEIESIRSQIDAKHHEIVRAILLMLGVLALMGIFGWIGGWTRTIPFWIALIPVVWFLKVQLLDMVKLVHDLQNFDSATPRRLEEGPRANLEVSWWELVKTYQVRKPESPHFSREIELAGAPFRLLTLHGRRIPVILSSSRSKDLKSTHRVRLAAYSYLITTEENASHSDWGVVIFKDTKRGFAIPLGSNDRNTMFAKLEDLRATLKSVARGMEPAKAHPNACAGCPLNRPRVYHKGISETKIIDQKLVPYLPKDVTRHCDCGDRFQWTPPTYAGGKSNS